MSKVRGLLLAGILIVVVMVVSNGVEGQVKVNDIFTKLVMNEGDLTKGTAIFKIKIPQASSITTRRGSLDEFTFEGIKAKGRPLLRFDTFILQNVTRNVTIMKTKITYKTCFNLLNETGNTNPYNCSYETRFGVLKLRTMEEYVATNLNNYTWNAGEAYTIKVVGRWKAGLGPQAIDWVPTFKIAGVELRKSEWAWWNTSWDNKVPITVNNSGTTDLLNFTINVSINTSGLIAEGKMNSSCKDIRFTDITESVELAFEFDDFLNDTSGCDPGLGNITALWVNILNLSNSAVNTTIYIYYNNPSADFGNDTDATWNESYIGVWHTSATNFTIDSSGNNHNGSTGGTITPVPGFFGGGAEKDPGGDSHISVPYASSMDMTSNRGTMELWFKYDGVDCPDTSFCKLLDKRITGQGRQDYFLDLAETSSFKVRCDFSSTSAFIGGMSSYIPPADEWIYLVCVYDGSDVLLYVNGTLEDNISSPGSVTLQNSNQDIRLAGTDDEVSSVGGIYDEFRISNKALTPDEILRNFESGLASLGAEETSVTNTAPTVDTTTEPTNPSVYSYTATYTFFANISDEDLVADIDTVFFEFDGTNLTATNTTNINTTMDQYNYTINARGVGNYTFNWYVNDSTGASAAGTSSSFNITQATPNVNAFIDNSSANSTVNYPVTVEIRGNSSTSDPDAPTFTLYLNGTSLGAGNPATGNVEEGVGTLQVNYSTPGNQNYTYAENTSVHLIVNQGTPDVMVYLNNISANLTVTYPVAVEITGNSTTGGTSPPTFTLYIGSTSLGSGNPVIINLVQGLGAHMLNYTTPGNANYSYAENVSIYLTMNIGDGNISSSTINETQVSINETVLVVVNASSGAIINLTLNTSGGVANHTMAWNGSVYTFTLTKTELGDLESNATIINISSFSLNGGNYTLESIASTLNFSYGLNTAPTVDSLTEPTDPSAYSYTATYTFFANISDEDLVADINTVLFEFDGTNTTATNLTNVNITTDQYNFTIDARGAGTYTYNWYVNDSTGSTGAGTSTTFTIAPGTGNITSFLINESYININQTVLLIVEASIGSVVNATINSSGGTTNHTLIWNGSQHTFLINKSQLGDNSDNATIINLSSFSLNGGNYTLVSNSSTLNFSYGLTSLTNITTVPNVTDNDVGSGVTFQTNYSTSLGVAVNGTCIVTFQGTNTTMNFSNNFHSVFVSTAGQPTGFIGFDITCTDSSYQTQVNLTAGVVQVTGIITGGTGGGGQFGGADPTTFSATPQEITNELTPGRTYRSEITVFNVSQSDIINAQIECTEDQSCKWVTLIRKGINSKDFVTFPVNRLDNFTFHIEVAIPEDAESAETVMFSIQLSDFGQDDVKSVNYTLQSPTQIRRATFLDFTIWRTLKVVHVIIIAGIVVAVFMVYLLARRVGTKKVRVSGSGV